MWNCKTCSTVVDDSFEICWKCGTSKDGVEDPDFVSADETSPIIDPRYDPVATPDPSIQEQWLSVHGGRGDELVACYQAGSLPEAKFIADELIGAGIAAMADTIDMQDALGPLSGNPRVYCRQHDLEAARAWLDVYEPRRADSSSS